MAIAIGMNNIFVSSLAVILSLCCGSTSVTAAPYPCPHINYSPGLDAESFNYQLLQRPVGNVLYAIGGVGEGESARMEAAVRKVMSMPGGLHEVWLNSPGGDAIQGIEIGRVLRKYGAATRVPRGAMCMSACSYAFLGGVFRAVEPGAAYGLHMFSRARGRAGEVGDALVADIDSGNNQLKNTIARIRIIEQETAQTAATRYEYLLAMGVSVQVARYAFSVSAEDVGCPPNKQLVQWNVVNAE